MRLVLALTCVIVSSLPPVVLADPVVVVSATRTEQPERTVGSSTSVFTAKEIAALQVTNTLDLLRLVPGLDVVQNGNRGGNASVFIRGANPEHTLVLIDGIIANNPINPTRAYNFSDLNIDNIERIEIIRGPQSTLYGSDAIGGVISIVTKLGADTPQSEIAVEAGAYETSVFRASTSGRSDSLSYSLAYSRTDADGYSAARGGEEEDGYYENNGSLRLAFDPAEDFGIDLISRYSDSLADLDDGGGAFSDDPNRRIAQQQAFFRTGLRAKGFGGKLEQTYGISLTHQRYDDDDEADSNQPLEVLQSDFTGQTLLFDTQQTLTISDAVQLIFGGETKRERGWSHYFSDGDFGPYESNFPDTRTRTNAAFGQVLLSHDDMLFLALGVRHDNHNASEGETTWRVAPRISFAETGTELFGSIGTAFKAPSLYQLYSEFGSADLKPEKSFGLDAGIGQSLFGETLHIEASYFYNDIEELITFEPNTFLFENIADAKTSGVEAGITLSLSESLTTNVNYTYLDSEDESTGRELLRRAKHKVNADVTYSEPRSFSVTARVRHVGERADNDFSSFPATRTELNAYTTFDLLGNVYLRENIELFGRAENLFDKEYEDVLGFGTPGASVFLGVRVRTS